MRILEYGWVNPQQVKCNHCGSILEWVPNDLLLSIKGKYYLICLVCGKTIHTDNYGQPLQKKEMIIE